MTSFADVSHWQTSVDLAAYAAAGYDRVAMKATEATTVVDPAFTTRWRRAGELGLARIAYHFARTAGSGVAEFDHFLATVTAAGGPGPRDLLCLDVEDPTGTARADAYAGEFTRRAAARGYPTGCVYTGRWYAEPANLRPDDLVPGWRHLWLSDYTSAADPAVTLPSGWGRGQLLARQYTNAAQIPGVTGPCDANRVITDWIKERDMPLTADDKDWIRQTLLTQARAVLSTRQDPGAATPRELLAAWPRETAALRSGIASLAHGDDPTPSTGDTHPDNLRRLRGELGELAAKVDALAATGVDVDALAAAIVAKLPAGGIDPAALAVAVADELHQRMAS